MYPRKRSAQLWVTFFMCVFLLCSCIAPQQVFPEEGVWYCEGLQLQLSFGEGVEEFMVIDGEKIRCTALNDRGSDRIVILCQEFDDDVFGLGEAIIVLQHIERAGNEWVLEDDSGRRYRFERQDQNVDPSHVLTQGTTQ